MILSSESEIALFGVSGNARNANTQLEVHNWDAAEVPGTKTAQHPGKETDSVSEPTTGSKRRSHYTKFLPNFNTLHFILLNLNNIIM